jgi:hypothetical protein
MKSTSWKKEWLVIAHSDYDNTWSALTIPCTFKQASAFINNARYASRYERGLIRFVTVSEFEQMQKKVTWKHDAPFNPQFLGAQRPQACQDY